ncbi:hypothetical protein IT417_01360 [bacterium]|nr:hypothetical protein [bacterium]
MIKSLLLPREDYSREIQKYKDEFPVFEIIRPQQALFYFGANHSQDPKNSQYPFLKEYWRTFLECTEGKEKIVLIEGGLRKLEEDEESAIINSGSEGGLMTLLAHQENIPVACPDLNDMELTKGMIEEDRYKFLLYRFLSWHDSFQRYRNSRKFNFEIEAQQWCEAQSSRVVWEKLEVSLPKLKELFKKLLGKEFNEKEKSNDYVNPNIGGTVINKVAQTSSDLRDAYIVSEIKRYWSEGKCIFVVFGSGHLVIQRIALEVALK